MGTRHVSGDPWPVEVDMAAATVCYKGDFIVQSLADPQIGFPASNTVLHETDLATIQELAHDSFIGIALEDKVAGKAKAVQVATEGIFEIPITAATAAVVGALFGPDNAGTHTAIVDQRAVLVAAANLSFGVLVKPTLAADTHAHIRIFGTKTTGGMQTMV
jgi:predicted RecA/RadA family phage recombinase